MILLIIVYVIKIWSKNRIKSKIQGCLVLNNGF